MPTFPRPASRRRLAPLGAAAVASAVLIIGPAAVPATADGSLVTNPGFETGTTGWKGGSATLSRVHSGQTGDWSGRLRNTSSSAKTVVLNDVANTVARTAKGRTVSAAAWVRTDKPGTSVGLRLMEYAGSSLRGQAQGSVWLKDTGWHRVTVSYKPVSTGASLDLNVLGWALPGGGSVFVDNVWAGVGTSARATPARQPASEPIPDPAGWTLAWADEFSGSTVDSSKWRVRNNDYNSYEASYLLARNVRQSNGVLKITAKREAVGGRMFSSGYLDTVGKTNFGANTRYEIRAKVPTQKGVTGGLWPAFWLRSNENGGEIDVAEFYGSPHPHMKNAHTSVDNIVHEDTNGGKRKAGKNYTLPGGARPSDGFHIYAVDVLSDRIVFSVDGVTSHIVTKADYPWISQMLAGTWNMRLNLQVGKQGSWATAPTSAMQFPATFAVDYVRVYTR